LLVIAVTGAIYVFRGEIEDAARPDLAFVQPSSEPKSVDELLAAVQVAHPDKKPVRISVPADRGRSVVVQVESNETPALGQTRAVYVNPYTAEILGDGPSRSVFFAGVLKLHRTLFAGTTGRIAVELTTSWTIVLLVSGLVLWWPKRLTQLWGVWLPRLRSSRYVVLRDLHTVPGVYLAPIAAVVAVTGLFYTVVWLWGYNQATGNAGNFPSAFRAVPDVQPPTLTARRVPSELALVAARERWPGLDYSLQLPKKPSDAYIVTVRGENGGPSICGIVGVDPFTGTVIADNRYDNLPLLQWARVWVLPLHMGTIAGTPTKILAFVTCLVLSGLAVSGVWMWLVRRPHGRTGFPRTVDSSVPKPAALLIVVLAVLLPTVGISLVLVLIGEGLLLRFTRRPSTNPAADVPSSIPVITATDKVSS